MKNAPKRNIRFIVACGLVILSMTGYGQKFSGIPAGPAILHAPLEKKPAPVFSPSMIRGFSEPSWNGKLGPAGHMEAIPADYYARNLGIMCRFESGFEKSTRLPLRLRLGSLEYCNRLEGKN